MAKKLKERRTSSSVAVYRLKGKKKKKRTKALKFTGKSLDRWAKANDAFASEFKKRNDKESRKKKDGGLKKFNKNYYKALKKGRKKLKMKKIMGI